jgi:hypothetical protein
MNMLATSIDQMIPVDDSKYWIFRDDKLEYDGPGKIIWIHGLRLACTIAFADGYHCACKVAGQWDILDLYLPTDFELTALINQHLPATVPTAQVNEWRRGFVLGWVMMWESPNFEEIDRNGKGYNYT